MLWGSTEAGDQTTGTGYFDSQRAPKESIATASLVGQACSKQGSLLLLRILRRKFQWLRLRREALALRKAQGEAYGSMLKLMMENFPN